MAAPAYQSAGLINMPQKPTLFGQKRSDIYLVGSEYQELKGRIHDRLLELLDFSLIDSLDRQALRQEIVKLVEQIMGGETVPLNLRERERLVKEVQDEVLGLGPLEPFLQDPTVSDILVNTHQQIYVERRGKLERTEARFKDAAHLRKIIDRIVSNVGRRIDESSPMVDARLPDGSRVNAIIPPLAVDGPILSIRRFAVDPLKLEDLVTLKTLTPEMGAFFREVVCARLNMLIAGGTGSGKTTLLNVMSSFVPATERIVTIEDSAELQLRQDHVARLETRPAAIVSMSAIHHLDPSEKQQLYARCFTALADGGVLLNGDEVRAAGDAEMRLRARHERFAAHGLTRFGPAEFQDMAAGGLGPEVMVEGDHAVHLGA